MRISKTFIVRHDSKISKEYSAFTAKTVGEVQMKYEYLDWESDPQKAWNRIDLDIEKKFDYLPHYEKYHMVEDGAECITLAHIHLWEYAAKHNECIAIMEHDFCVNRRYDTVDIPVGFFVGMGYKLREPWRMNLRSINGQHSTQLVLVKTIHGAHGYAIHPETAKILLEEIKEKGVKGYIDCYWMQNTFGGTQVKTCMMDPIVGVGYIRESTIWHTASATNGPMTRGFQEIINIQY